MRLKHIIKLFIVIISLNQLAAQCVDTTLINPNGMCVALYDPVCGCNGKTYENICTAETIDGITSTTTGICAVTQLETICLGTNVQIGVNSDSLSTYIWDPSNDLSCTSCANPVASPTTSTLYELTKTDTSGTLTYTYFEIVIEPCPTQTDIICLGENIQIGVSTDSLSTYTWSPTNNLSCSNCADPTANPSTNTTYELTATDFSGVATRSYFEIIIEPCPTQIDTICIGDNIQIGVSPDTLKTYAWYPINNLSCTNCANPIASPTTNIAYELTVTDTSGVAARSYFEIVAEDCSICGINGGFSYQVNDIAKIGDNPTSQIDLEINFTQNFQSDDACIWAWDFGNGMTATTRNPAGIVFSTVKDSLPVTQAYDVCMSVFDCNNQLIETCCQAIGPFTNCPEDTFIDAVQGCNNTNDPVKPICGCNNKSYPNICNAINTDGVHNWTDGPCSIDSVYQICPAKSVRIIPSTYTSGVQYRWYPSNSVSCSTCFQTNASPNQNTLYQLTRTNNSTGVKTHEYYQVNVLSNASCCTSENLRWLDTLLDDDFCDECYSEVQQIKVDGLDFVYFKKDSVNCPNAFSSLTYCNGSVFCREDATGFCLDSLDYTVKENVWSKDAFCNLCGVSSMNDIDWLYNTYGNGDYDVSRYSHNNSIAFYIEKCNTLRSDTLTKMLVNCNNDLICGWDGSTPLLDEANCSNFFTEGIFVEQLINCGCIDISLIDPNASCSSFTAAICGCDGISYNNFCTAQKTAGITSWTAGACNSSNNCIDTLQVFSGFIESQQLKAKEVIQTTVPVIGNNAVTMEAHRSIELLSGFDCPKNSTLNIDIKFCY